MGQTTQLFQQQLHEKSTDIQNRCLNIYQKALKMIKKDTLYSKEKVNYQINQDRRVHSSNKATEITDLNINNRTD